MSEDRERQENNEQLQKEIELEFIQNDDDKVSNNTNSTQTTNNKPKKETTILQNSATQRVPPTHDTNDRSQDPHWKNDLYQGRALP